MIPSLNIITYHHDQQNLKSCQHPPPVLFAILATVGEQAKGIIKLAHASSCYEIDVVEYLELD